MNPGESGNYDADFVAAHSSKYLKLLKFWFRPEIIGLDNIPDEQFIGIGNHSGGVMMPDTFLWIFTYQSLGYLKPMLTLGSKLIFSTYPKKLSHTLSKIGGIKADAKIALAEIYRGNSLMIYPGGDQDACRSFWNRNKIVFADSKVYAKLAIKTGLPILPVVSYGAHKSCFILWDGVSLAKALKIDKTIGLTALPLILCFPWGLWLGPVPGYIPFPTKIKLSILPPVYPIGSAESLDKKVRTLMQAELDRLKNSRH